MTDLFVLPSHPYSNEADYAFAMEHSPQSQGPGNHTIVEHWVKTLR